MTDPYFLSRGSHASPAEGRCALEWVCYLAGEPHSDSPVCVSPFLRQLGVMVNDRLDDGPRQRLRPYLARMIGTAGDGLDARRRQQVIDWYLREAAPLLMDAAGRKGAAFGRRSRACRRASMAVAAHAAHVAHVAYAAYAAYAADAADASDVADAIDATYASDVAYAIDVANALAVAEIRQRVLASLFDLLDRLLPTVPVQLPVADSAGAVCAA